MPFGQSTASKQITWTSDISTRRKRETRAIKPCLNEITCEAQVRASWKGWVNKANVLPMTLEVSEIETLEDFEPPTRLKISKVVVKGVRSYKVGSHN